MHGLVWIVEINESLKSIKERIIKNGAIPVRPFHVDYLCYRPKNKAQGIRPVSLFHHSAYPASSFLLSSPCLETGKMAKCIADRGFDLILLKLKSGLEADNSGYFESDGMEYIHGDFKIRVGAASMANSKFKGITLEVEYVPFALVEYGIDFLMEYTHALINDGIKRQSTHLKYLMDKKDQYSPLDTMQQYKEIFTEMRNRTKIIGENFTTLKTCGHVFHYDCVEQWVTRSKSCPVCRIKTHSNQMLKLFFEQVPTIDVEKLVIENQKLLTKLEENQRMTEELKYDTLQKQLIETIVEKEEYERNLKVEKQFHKRILKSMKKESSNCTIDLTYSPPKIPRKKRSKRTESSGAAPKDAKDSESKDQPAKEADELEKE
uniref:Mediator of RNA polymerase II transcription subunit 20 n=1 Tax=Panagrolaimus sp. PS1159 TaxID=55785 RepID=A0AC35GCX4_9BILA